jgi:hypothetical protein
MLLSAAPAKRSAGFEADRLNGLNPELGESPGPSKHIERLIEATYRPVL